jgi:hypothetical protein
VQVNEYCALFVALIGEGKEPQGVINTSEGKVVRAFHRFTLVDQKSGRDIMKGRQRADGAVKISCARQDPNARNCHGYRKFVKKAVLEDPTRGFLLDDRIVIRYTIELVVSQARRSRFCAAVVRSGLCPTAACVLPAIRHIVHDRTCSLAGAHVQLIPSLDQLVVAHTGDVLRLRADEVSQARYRMSARRS